MSEHRSPTYIKLTIPPEYLIKGLELYPENYRDFGYPAQGTYFTANMVDVFSDHDQVAAKDANRTAWALGENSRQRIPLAAPEKKQEINKKIDENQISSEARATSGITNDNKRIDVWALLEAIQSDNTIQPPLTFDETMALFYFATHDGQGAVLQGGFFGFPDITVPNLTAQLFGLGYQVVGSQGYDKSFRQVSRDSEGMLKITATFDYSVCLAYGAEGSSEKPLMKYSTEFNLKREANGTFTLQRNDGPGGSTMLVESNFYKFIIEKATERLKTSTLSDADLFLFVPLLTNSNFYRAFKAKLIQSNPSSERCKKIADNIRLCHAWDIHHQSPTFWQSNKGALTGLGTGLLIAGIVFGALLLALGPAGLVALGAIAVAVGAATAATTASLGMVGLLVDNNRKHPDDLLVQLASRESLMKIDNEEPEVIEHFAEENEVLAEEHKKKEVEDDFPKLVIDGFSDDDKSEDESKSDDDSDEEETHPPH